MNATTPLWVTVLLAVLAPVLTLFGVLWTQRAADRRADREARLRLEHEEETLLLQRRADVYANLLDAVLPMSMRAQRRCTPVTCATTSRRSSGIPTSVSAPRGTASGP